MITHSNCEKSMDSFEIVALSPVARYVWEEEEGEYGLAIDSDDEKVTYYACMACGAEVGGEDKQRLGELMRDDRS